MDLSFCAIDFETSSADRSSVCAVGVAKVRRGVIVDRFTSLVLPPTGLDSFHPRNVGIHGILPRDVADAPGWDTVFSKMMDFIRDDNLVAHNAAFDRSVMQAACTALDLDHPENAWHDSWALAKRILTLGSYSLPFVSAALGLDDFRHHHAGADAEQAALITVRLAERVGATDVDELVAHARVGAFGGASGSRKAGDFTGLEGSASLVGQFVAFTGKLTTNTREEAIAVVNHLGGTGQKGVTKKTTMLVTGDFDPTTLRPGAKFSTKLQKAMDLAGSGQPVEVVAELDFLSLIEVSREDLERVTREQRALTRGGGWLPAYVVEQARVANTAVLTYNAWMRAALRHPDGRSVSGDSCIRCGSEIDPGIFWLFSERHTCSSHCAEALKRAAKREWASVGIGRPVAPTYDELSRWKAR